jgi:hypothetical protein
MFIYCLCEDLKQKLINNKYTFREKSTIGGQPCWVFLNDGANVDFSQEDKSLYIKTNMMKFSN